jgi:predicted HNH restriction endonuclease
MFAVITENDISQWDDHTGIKYNFPVRYHTILKPGTQIVYYKGRMTDKKFKSARLTTHPHYFGRGTIGKVYQEENRKDYYAEILNFEIFPKAVPFKQNGKPIEEIPSKRIKNYWRAGVRQISSQVYKSIMENAESLSKGNKFNDQKENEYITTVIEGGKKKIYTTKYERKKKSRDQALRVHGYTCEVCKFNFKDFYGDWGEGYVHVHHKKPLSSNNQEVIVDPETDLAVVCANCHSMIHRRRDKILSIEELKQLVFDAR